MNNLNRVRNEYLGKLTELGRDVDENVVIRYDFGKDAYRSETESNILLSENECIQAVRKSVFKDDIFMDTLKDESDEDYELLFKLEVSRRMKEFAVEIDLHIANKKHFILEVA